MKAITLHQPWATWVAMGWKTIETRTHHRFQGLVGKRIAIHAAHKFDNTAIEAAWDFLDDWQREMCTEMSLYQKGVVLCTAQVVKSHVLYSQHSLNALIECRDTWRVGLFLSEVELVTPAVPAKGRQGIWNWTPTKEADNGED